MLNCRQINYTESKGDKQAAHILGYRLRFLGVECPQESQPCCWGGGAVHDFPPLPQEPQVLGPEPSVHPQGCPASPLLTSLPSDGLGQGDPDEAPRLPRGSCSQAAAPQSPGPQVPPTSTSWRTQRSPAAANRARCWAP